MNLAISDSTTSERIRAHFVTGSFFSVLGVQPLYGRTLTTDDEVFTSDTPPVVLSSPFWKRRFQADAGVIGRTILLQGRRCLFVGVMSKSSNGISAKPTPPPRIPFTAVASISADRY